MIRDLVCLLVVSGLGSAASINRELATNALPQEGGATGLFSGTKIGSLFQPTVAAAEPGSIKSAVDAGKAKVGNTAGVESTDPEKGVLGRIKGLIGGEKVEPKDVPKKKKKSSKAEEEHYSIVELLSPYFPEEFHQLLSSVAAFVVDVNSDDRKHSLRTLLLQTKLFMNLAIDVTAKSLETPGDKNALGSAKTIAGDASSFIDLLNNSLLEELQTNQLPADGAASQATLTGMSAAIEALKKFSTEKK